MIKPGESAYYFHNDHLGTPQILTDGNGTVAWKAVYMPFGGTQILVQSVENPFRFPGQYYDQETGVNYNYFRYYNPPIGRYITPDPIGLEGGVNLFTYVENQPIKGIDPANNAEIERRANDDEPFSALAFKVATDPFVGQLTFFRVYSGSLKVGTYFSEQLNELGLYCTTITKIILEAGQNIVIIPNINKDKEYEIENDRKKKTKQPKTSNVKLLKQYPEFLEFQKLKGTGSGDKVPDSKETSDVSTATPSEALEAAYENLRDELVDELLTRLKKISPAFFERVVVELLVKMGYGGSRADAGKAIGRSGDGGIDGIIKEDKLGLDVVYIQAKRWDNNPVGRPDVMQFAAALQAQRANKGIFITTTRFTDDARNYVSQIGSEIVLIDGEQLTSLRIEHDVGVSTVSLYPVKKVDSDYFEESV